MTVPQVLQSAVSRPGSSLCTSEFISAFVQSPTRLLTFSLAQLYPWRVQRHDLVAVSAWSLIYMPRADIHTQRSYVSCLNLILLQGAHVHLSHLSHTIDCTSPSFSLLVPQTQTCSLSSPPGSLDAVHGWHYWRAHRVPIRPTAAQVPYVGPGAGRPDV
jgi:hypothetical protein